jgi:lipopolysaccharide/colanic/teichoic acid biosynthesis glycosyltransferase
MLRSIRGYRDVFSVREERGARPPRALGAGEQEIGTVAGGQETPGEAGRLAARAPGRMRARRHKLFLLLAVQLFFSGLLWVAAADIARVLYPTDNPLSPRLVLPLGVLFLSYFLLAWRSVYSRDYHYYLRRTHGILLKYSSIPVALTCAAFLLLGSGKYLPVPMLLIFLAAGFLSFPFAEGCQKLWISYLARLGYFRKKILLVGRPGQGGPEDARARDFGSTKTYAGQIDRSNGAWVWRPARGGPDVVLEDSAQIRSLILTENIGDVLVFRGGSDGGGLEGELIDHCHSLAIGYYLVPPGPVMKQTGIAGLLFPDLPVSERFAGSRDSLTAVSLKRMLDIAISIICLALFLPAGLLIALAILAEDGGPVFYVSTRVGKNGRPINFLKFRTMVRDAEKQKEGLLPHNARADGPLFKMKNDPRVTRVGGLLRRYSFDEFPQLLNVLAGSMSIVGPRPHLPHEVTAYRDGDYLRLECMPGIVGLPQVSGRSATMGFREWVDLDLSYRRSWSLALDASIMAGTLRVFFRGLLSRPSSGHY